MTEPTKPRLPEPIYATEFPNQFGEWQLLHATRSMEKAFNDAGRTGRVLTLVERIYVAAEIKALESANAELSRKLARARVCYQDALEKSGCREVEITMKCYDWYLAELNGDK